MLFNPLIAALTLDWSMSALGLAAPLAAGVIAGLTVIGAIHYLTRSRKVSAPPKRDKQVKPASDPFITGSASEKRKSVRRPGNPIEVQIFDKTMHAVPITAYVVNRSVGGLCLQMDR